MALDSSPSKNPAVVIGAGFGGLLHSKYGKPLFDEFDARILRTPIAELGFCGLGIGAAMAGLYPIVTIGPAASRSRPSCRSSTRRPTSPT